ncbi:MAG: hypothetical protein AVDCRST_MAG40-2016 [uncultured Gemmatimonadaceae bacterium]|uniref:Uncharacterized protein n=1 Tax=uncultured Gemmatimonadaceae bacterium TaxID=246130 RepID=A0A6J4LGG1_9BACT|nr:MAG: hypothetical protein AVDCRST_MAG40-2016 [uncultured Gemmatimonadaceae bacterium]
MAFIGHRRRAAPRRLAHERHTDTRKRPPVRGGRSAGDRCRGRRGGGTGAGVMRSIVRHSGGAQPLRAGRLVGCSAAFGTRVGARS